MTSPSVPLSGGGGTMPLLGFGTWQAQGTECYDAVRVALDAGYRHIDTATMYGNEAEVGRALRDSGVDRAEVFVTTKLPPERAGRERRTIDASLKALGIDQLDLWLIHWPPRGRSTEVWQEFIAARDEGLTRAIGVSNYSSRQIDALTKETGETPSVNQIKWGPALYDADEVAAHRERGVVLEGYSPFKTTNLRDKDLVAIAEAHGVTPAQVIVRWHLQHGFVVIPKSVTPDRIRTNFDAFGFTLSDEEMRRIDGLSR